MVNSSQNDLADTLNRGAGCLSLPSMRVPFVRRLAAALDRRCGIGAGSRLVVAVSGGADSMALLAGLSRLAGRSNRGYRLEVVYVHHHLRAEAEVELAAVANTAGELGWDFHSCAIYPQNETRSAGNLAACARELRYQALSDIARATNADVIVTGHHGTDQLETVLLTLIRGASIAGLSAMRWRTDVTTDGAGTGVGMGPGMGVPIVRPLLDQAHQDCVDLCESIHWPWFEDHSNQDEARRRNLLRAKVLPVLREIVPDLETRVWRTTDLLAEAATLIDEIVVESFPNGVTDDGVTTWSRAGLVDLNILVLGAGLRRVIQQQTGSIDGISFPMVEQLITAIRDHATHPRVFNWPNGLQITLINNHLEMRLVVETNSKKTESS